MWHRRGKVSLTKGSDIVTGVGTDWVENIRVGDAFQGPDGKLYQVINVASNEALAISPAYEGNTATNLNYWIVPIPGYSKTQADRLSLIINRLDRDMVTMEEAMEQAQIAAQQTQRWRDEAQLAAETAALDAQRAEQAQAVAQQAEQWRDEAQLAAKAAALDAERVELAAASHKSSILSSAETVSVNIRSATLFHLTLDRDKTRLAFVGDSQFVDQFQQFSLILKQGTGSNLVEWPDNIRWSFGNEPALSFTQGCEDVITFMKQGTNSFFYGFFNGGGLDG